MSPTPNLDPTTWPSRRPAPTTTTTASLTLKKRPLYASALTALLPPTYLDASTLRQIPDNQEVLLSPTGLTSVIFEITERVDIEGGFEVGGDEEAARFHYMDIVGSGSGSGKKGRDGGKGEEVEVEEEEEEEEETKIVDGPKRVLIPSLGQDMPVLYLFGLQIPRRPPSRASPQTQTQPSTQTRPPQDRPAPQPQPNSHPTPSFTALILLVIRLEAQRTDILITINMPHVPGEDGFWHEGDVDPAKGRWGLIMEEGFGILDGVVQGFGVQDWGLFDSGEGS